VRGSQVQAMVVWWWQCENEKQKAISSWGNGM
jgi:hypothetical protein